MFLGLIHVGTLCVRMLCHILHIHLLMGTRVVFPFMNTAVMKIGYEYLFQSLHSVPLLIYLGEASLDYTVILY